MKKLLLLVVLIMSVCVIGFADHETWFTAGMSYGNYFMTRNDIDDGHTGSLGVNLNFYSIPEKSNLGFFFDLGILFPLVHNIGGYEHSDQFDLTIGVGLAISLTKDLKLYFGGGPNVNFLVVTEDRDKEMNTGSYLLGLGIGGDIGLKYYINTLVSINLGTTLSFHFAGDCDRKRFDSGTNTYQYINEWIPGFFMFGIKPYIGAGFHFY